MAPAQPVRMVRAAARGPACALTRPPRSTRGLREDAASAPRDSVTEPGGHVEAALELASAVARNGPLGVRSAKAALDDVAQRPHQDPWPRAHALRKALNGTADFAEALAAFEQKRPPVFRGV